MASHLDLYSNDNLNRDNKRRNDSDYQLYGEPPPSYDQSKYFPQTTTFESNSQTDEVHIYENIDESPSNSTNSTEATNKQKRKLKSTHKKKSNSLSKQPNELPSSQLNLKFKNNNDELL